MRTKAMCLMALGSLLFFSPLPAQPPNYEEIADTIRFIRLAESKRRLDLSEDKLLKVNEAFERFEQKRFSLVRRENELKRMALEGLYTDDTVEQMIDELLGIRKQIHKNEAELWEGIQTFLEPREVVQVWIFYEKFQREVFKKIRGIQERRANRPNLGDRRRNPR